MIREMKREEIPECVDLIRRSFLTVAEKFDFFPFTCGYLQKEI